MQVQKKTKNWNYLKTGLVFIIFSLLPLNHTVKSTDLVVKTITAYKPIYKIRGSSYRYSYRIWANEYKNPFVIRRSVNMTDKKRILDKIDKGDQLRISIQRSDLSRLANTSYQIVVYGLMRNGQEVFNADSYNISEKLVNYRWRIVSFLAGILFTLRGLNYISRRISYLLAGLFIGSILLLRILQIGW